MGLHTTWESICKMKEVSEERINIEKINLLDSKNDTHNGSNTVFTEEEILDNHIDSLEFKSNQPTHEKEIKQKLEIKHDFKEGFIANSISEISNEAEIEYLPNDDFSTAEQEAMDIIQNLGSCTEIKTDFSNKKEIKQELEVKQEIKEEFIENNLVPFLPECSKKFKVEYPPKDEFSTAEQEAVDIIQNLGSCTEIKTEFDPKKEIKQEFDVKQEIK